MEQLGSPRHDLGDELHELPDLVILADLTTMEVLDVNRHGAAQLGYETGDMMGRKLSEFGDQSDTSLNPELIEGARRGDTVRFDRRVRRRDGEWRNYNFAARKVGGCDGRFLLIGREMEALAHSHSKLADLLRLADLTDDIFVVWDKHGILTYANAAAARMHGDMTFVGRQVEDFVHEDDQGLKHLRAAMRDRGTAHGRVTTKRADGSPLQLCVKTAYDHETEQWFTVERDITTTIEVERELRRLNEHLRSQATTDALTGVANRNALNEVLAEAVDLGDTFALMLLDMDDFKSVNDTFGHVVGDEFLRCVAQRLQGAVRLTDTVARLGGDEFVVFLPGIGGREASAIAKRMIEAVGSPYSIAGAGIMRSCSIGIAVYEPGDDVSAVLRKADRAAYQAKHAGRSRFSVFS